MCLDCRSAGRELRHTVHGDNIQTQTQDLTAARQHILYLAARNGKETDLFLHAQTERRCLVGRFKTQEHHQGNID